jgi:peptidoglycan hydrolase-like protein with peptidoglycan-binding domain
MRKYLISGIVAIALAFALGSSVADAQTVMFTRNLTIGSRGNDVAALQAWLIGRGYTIPAITFGRTIPGYFGTETRAAVMAYQRANGIPATGYFGPLTMASINSRGVGGGVVVNPNCPAGFTCTPTQTIPICPPGYTCIPIGGNNNNQGGSLRGNFGTIDDVSELSQFNDEEVGEGEDEVRVLGFEVETANEGDILIRSMRVVFDPNDTSGSTRLERYIDGVTIWMDNKEVGSADVEDFNENNDDVYTATIVLNNSAIVRADSTENFYVTVDAASNLDSDDIESDDWTIDVDSIRYEDASGVVTTETSVGDIGSMDVPVNFVSFSESADTELRISKDSDSPDEGIVIVDNDGEDDVVLLRGSIEVEGDSDITIDEIPVTLTVGDGATDVDQVINTLRLDIGGNEYAENVTSTSTTVVITFDDLDLTIDAGDTIDFTIMGDINDVDDFTDGSTLTASITANNVDDIDAENEQGDQIDDGDRSGTALGEEQQFRETGIAPRLVSTGTSVTSNQNANDDIGSFRIRFSITGAGDSVYVSADPDGYIYSVERGTTEVTAGTSSTIVNLTDDDETANGNFLIEEGETETFELTITAQLPTAGTSGQYRALLEGIKWDTDDDATLDNTYTTNLDQFRTSYAVLN